MDDLNKQPSDNEMEPEALAPENLNQKLEALMQMIKDFYGTSVK